MADRAQHADVPVLEVESLVVQYGNGVRAVDGATLRLFRGEALGLVGTSGCGKSTLAHAAVRLVPPAAGSIRAFGEDVTRWGPRRMRPLRRRLQIVFQDVDGSLNPQMQAWQVIEEPLRVHGVDAAQRRRSVRHIAQRVGLEPDALDRRPQEFSGGQRQRIALARALVVQPDVLVCDEPFSSLDLAVQAQIVDLLGAVRKDLGLSVLFITHDLALARHLCDRIAVMHAGRIVETARAEDLFRRPEQEPTRRLLEAARKLSSPRVWSTDLPGTMPS